MKKVATGVMVLLLLSGCGPSGKELADSKAFEICEEIVRSIVPDPSSTKTNRIKLTEGKLSADELEQFLLIRFDGEMPPSNAALIERHKKEPESLSEFFVEVDYTTQGKNGPTRDRAICRYLQRWEKRELISVTIRGRDYVHNELLMLLLQYGTPKSLDSINNIK